FQKAESDLDYIERRLEYEMMRSLPDDTGEKENLPAVLKELPVLKSRYKSLCARMEEVSREQKESMEGIRAALEKTVKIVQAIQQQTDLE
ncbi:SKA2 protein, partial [Ploceus nigricollis]|nr:SKA2 protein [Ploceus nigricollis]